MLGMRLSHLQSSDSVEGKGCPPLKTHLVFLPVVPKTNSRKPDLFQQIEYLTKERQNHKFSQNWQWIQYNYHKMKKELKMATNHTNTLGGTGASKK